MSAASRRDRVLAKRLTAVTVALLGIVACGRTQGLPPASESATKDAGPGVVPSTAASSGPSREACDIGDGTWPPSSFLLAARILHVRVASAKAGPEWGGFRCVALDLEVREVFRGQPTERPGDLVHLIVKQNIVPLSTARPAGAWWVGEQTLEPAREYVAFCGPEGTLDEALRGSCSVIAAASDLLGDLRLAREAESHAMPARELIDRTRAQCASTSYLLMDYVLTRTADEVRRDERLFDALASLAEYPACTKIARDMLVSRLVLDNSPAHTRRIARAMLHILAMPEAAQLHDHIVAPYLPSLLGLMGGRPKVTAAEVFGADRADRARADAALRAYHGRSDAEPLRAWLAR